jgi:sulfonate dioxygenase
VNDEWITGIQGWKKEETDWLIKYLMDHISKGHDYQIRLQWKPKTVVIFDNRSTCRKYPNVSKARKEADIDRHGDCGL